MPSVKDVKKADRLGVLGTMSLNLDKYEEAIFYFNSAIKLTPDNDSILLNRGCSYKFLNKHELAIKDFTRVLTLKPRIKAYINRAESHSLLDEHRLAIDDINMAFELKIQQQHEAYQEDIVWPIAFSCRGMAYYNMEEFKLAIEDFNAALLDKPDEESTLFYLGVSLGKIGKTKKAISILSRLLDQDPANTFVRINRAQLYQERGELVSCAADLSSILKAEPEHHEVLILLADINVTLQQPDAAIKNYINASKLAPTNAYPLIQCGELYVEKGAKKLAVAFYTKALAVNKGDKQLMLSIARLHLEINNNAQAISFFNLLILSDGQNPLYFYLRATGHEKNGEYDDALADVTQALLLDNEYIDAYKLRADILSFKGNHLLALQDYTAVIDKNPLDANVCLNIAVCQTALKNWEKVIVICNTVLEIDARYIEPYSFRANAWFHLGEFKKSIEDNLSYKNLNTNPDLFSQNHYNLGLSYQRHGDLIAAIFWLNKSLELNDTFADALHAIAVAHVLNSSFDLALQAFNKLSAVSTVDLDANFYYNRGSAYFNLKDYKVALKDFEKALELAPGDVDTINYLQRAKDIIARSQPLLNMLRHTFINNKTAVTQIDLNQDKLLCI